MRIFGVDLAAQAAETAYVVIEAGCPELRVVGFETSCDDDTLVRLADDTSKIAVDCPLGWPSQFVAAVSAHHLHQPWPSSQPKALTHRLTDRRVAGKIRKWPLAVSADKIAVVAFRCPGLQHRWAAAWGGPQPRDGSDRPVEAYPGATLKQWGILLGDPSALPHQRYKGRDHRSERATIMDLFAGWADVDLIYDACIASDHVLDAFICALVGLAAARGMTEGPGPDDLQLALTEGWIHLPTATPAELWFAAGRW